jgi:hypothetical protein
VIPLPPPDLLADRVQKAFAGKATRWLKTNTGYGPCHGSCLLVANALQCLLPESQVVSLVRCDYGDDGGDDQVPTLPLEAEHYGVRWQGWYFDGLGGFPDAATWAEFFTLPLEHDLVMVPEFVPHYLIPDGSYFMDRTVAYLRKVLLGA